MTKKSMKNPKDPNIMSGRPLEYTQEMGDLICERIATHPLGLKRLCKKYDDMPAETTIQRWRYRVNGFRLQYAQAKMLQADVLAEECLDISDDTTQDIRVTEDGKTMIDGEFVARSRLRVDTRKWLASKLLPRQYGDKSLLEQKTEENELLKQELIMLRDKLNEQNRKDF
jgi:hypothetical protein